MGAFVISTTNRQPQIVKRQASLDEDSSDSRFWGHALSPCTFLCLQTPGGVTAVCWHANVSPTTLQLLRFPHLSQDMFITHSFGPKISVGTTNPGCVMNPPAACLVIHCFRSKGLLPPLSSLLCSSMSFTSLCFCSLFIFYFFYKEILVNKAVRSRGPNLDSRGRHITLPDGALMLQWISRCSNSS